MADLLTELSAPPQGGADLLSGLGYQASPPINPRVAALPTTFNAQAPTNMPPGNPNIHIPSAFENALDALHTGIKQGIGGIGQGFGEVTGDVIQGGARVGSWLGAVKPETVDKITAENEARKEQDIKDNPEGGVGRFVGTALPYSPMVAFPGTIGSIVAGALTGLTSGAKDNKDTLRNVALGSALGLTGLGVRGLAAAAGNLKAALPAIKASITPNYLKNEAYKLIDQGTVGKDVGEAIHSHVLDTYAALKGTSDDLFNQVGTIAKNIPEQVPLVNLQSNLNFQKGELSKVPSSFMSDTHTAALKDIMDKQAQIGANPNTTAENLLSMRKALNQTVRETEGVQKATAMSLIGSLDKDLNNFAQTAQHPELNAALKQANDFYKKSYIPFLQGNNTNAIQKIVNDKTNMDTVFKTFVKNNAPEAYGAMKPTPELNQTISSNILNSAFEGALKADGSFNANQFMKGVNKYGTTNELIHTPETLNKLQGFANLLQTSGAKSSLIGGLLKGLGSDSTVSQMTKTAIGAGLGSMMGGGIGGAVGATVGKVFPETAARWVTNGLMTPAMSKIMEKAATMNPNSPASKTALTGLMVGMLKHTKGLENLADLYSRPIQRTVDLTPYLNYVPPSKDGGEE